MFYTDEALDEGFGTTMNGHDELDEFVNWQPVDAPVVAPAVAPSTQPSYSCAEMLDAFREWLPVGAPAVPPGVAPGVAHNIQPSFSSADVAQPQLSEEGMMDMDELGKEYLIKEEQAQIAAAAAAAAAANAALANAAAAAAAAAVVAFNPSRPLPQPSPPSSSTSASSSSSPSSSSSSSSSPPPSPRLLAGAASAAPVKRGRGRPKGSKNKVQKNVSPASSSSDGSKVKRRKIGELFALEDNMVLETVHTMRKAGDQVYRQCEQHGRNDFKKAAMARNKLAQEQSQGRNNLQIFG